MKTSNFDRLLERYVTRKTSKAQTEKIEAMLDAMKKKDMHWISDETEELLFQKIMDRNSKPQQIGHFVKAFSKLRVGNVEWMKFKGIDVYFSKEGY